MMTQSSALYHVQRIHSMTGGLRLPIAWPHDGNVHDKGSGLGLAVQFKGYGANMMPKHAINHGTTDFRVEPGLQEMREMMFTGKLQIQPGNNELLEQMRHYHRDENFKISKGMDHLIDALRYAVMMRRSGKPKVGMRWDRLRPAALRRPAARRRGRLRVRHRHAKSPRRRVRPCSPGADIELLLIQLRSPAGVIVPLQRRGLKAALHASERLGVLYDDEHESKRAQQASRLIWPKLLDRLQSQNLRTEYRVGSPAIASRVSSEIFSSATRRRITARKSSVVRTIASGAGSASRHCSRPVNGKSVAARWTRAGGGGKRGGND